MISPYTAGALIIVALIVFGPSRLPEIGKALGKGIKEFKSGVTDESKKTEDTQMMNVTEQPKELPKAEDQTKQ
ncbi:MAG: twin-arginine translocase TatA/TatE family subunit [Selenomonas sp.]|uniref:Sec-independent protein translocase subunit TatA/TatB n=1 Tax=Selenomonas ruminantium TaxID=971 RepID=UPI001B2E1192|nr:twin-arginine translocase TatA/TatE family subunit [Selenomonas ruminantium]MBO5651271.1 twin-arginine translocase TatA/TatE family subunit [Selenomonas sp.]